MTSIYLVDDHTIVREGLRALLEGGGYEVVGESADPTVALADLQRLRPDLLLLDLNLDRRSGLELLTELQRRSLPVRCIVLTMSAQPRNVAEALRLGAAGYLLKGSPTHASPWAAPSPTQLTPPPGPLPHPDVLDVLEDMVQNLEAHPSLQIGTVRCAAPGHERTRADTAETAPCPWSLNR